MDSAKELTSIEFCAGYGGIHLGLRRALPNLRSVAFSEIEAFACANLAAKMESGCVDAAPIWTDVTTFPGESFRGKVDILVGGYPCQPFSAAGKRLGQDDSRHLWPSIREQIRKIEPTFCFFENVEGHISLGLTTVLSDLAEDGYRTTWGIFSASEVGAPHQRKRVFILAHKHSERLQRLGRDEHGAWRQSFGKDRHTTKSRISLWPSRPTEKQFKWEPPRILGYSKKQCSDGDTYYLQRSKRGFEPTSELRDSDDYLSWCDVGGTEPALGRDSDGNTYWVDAPELLTTFGHRVDELKLLGNGVVPAVAEKAWRTLYARLQE